MKQAAVHLTELVSGRFSRQKASPAIENEKVSLSRGLLISEEEVVLPEVRLF